MDSGFHTGILSVQHYLLQSGLFYLLISNLGLSFMCVYE